MIKSTINQSKVAINNFLEFIGENKIIIKSKKKITTNAEMVKIEDYKELLKYTETEKTEEQQLRYRCIIMLGGECESTT